MGLVDETLKKEERELKNKETCWSNDCTLFDHCSIVHWTM